MKLEIRNTTISLVFFSLIFCALAITSGTTPVHSQSRILNIVSAGGPDVADPDLPFETGPGVDKNYSLLAIKYADGTVNGELVDRFGSGLLPGTTMLRANIDCLYVEGNTAWVSGVVTQGLYIDDTGSVDFTGYYVRAVVQDNGPNNDPANPDKIGFSIIRQTAPWVCSEKRGLLFDMPAGQVNVR